MTPEAPRVRRLKPLWKWLRPVLGGLLFAGVLALAWNELAALDWPQVHAEILQTHWPILALAGLAVAANVGAMGLYDAVCFPRTPRLGFFVRWGIGSLCFAWTNFLTLGPIGGPALRMLVYTRRGLQPGQVARGLAVQYIGFVAALLAWLIAMALPLPAFGAALAVRVVLAAILAAVLSVTLRWVSVALLGRFNALPVTERAPCGAPAVRIGLVGFLDWGFSLAAFWLIAAAAGIVLDPFLTARAFFGGHIVGMASMLPGGLGSADATWLIVLTNAGHAPDEAAAVILLFRLVFYIAPWAAAVLATIAIASRARTELPWRPNAVAAAQFVGALFILVSAATPALRKEIEAREQTVPLALVESAHLAVVLASSLLALAGVRLVRRSRRAYLWSVGLMLVCVGAHLVKGGEPQESIVCALLLALLLLARRDFGETGLSAWPRAGATAGVLALALAVYLGVGLTAAVNVRWDLEVLGRFTHRAEFARLLRGGIALATLGAAMVVWRGVRGKS